MPNKNIQLILNKTTKHLGLAGDIIDVKKGYARNYLLPTKIAERVTKSRLNYIQQLEKQQILANEKRKNEAYNLKSQLDTINKFSLKRKISNNSNIFGSVTEKDIVDVIHNIVGMRIEKSQINLPEIKTLGQYNIDIHFIDNIQTTIKLQILPETI
uniref:Large ribosomal subunit protein bL9c n=1 Tax=Liagoropsis maxima TaxID=1653392 RepID=A0A1G4NVZ8_9FLOR|nr:Ribosomal protein L9 [Liagoropsis maxima]SCW22861.1 Ribosomal protein L9 [Liagoropsis maxima]